MTRMAEVEDARSIAYLITSASTTGDPLPDSENFDFKNVLADSGRS